MSGEQLKLDNKQAKAAVARAQKVYNEAEPGSVQGNCLLLLAEHKALEQLRDEELLQLRAAAGVTTHADCVRDV